MKKVFVFCSVILLSAILYWACNNSNTSRQSAELQVTQWYKQQLSTLKQSIDSFQQVIAQSQQVNYQEKFLAVRKQYKKVEWLVQYYHPETAKSINGAAILEAEPDAPEKIIEPLGLQVIETSLYPEVQDSCQPQVLALIKAMQESVTRLQTTADDNFLTLPHIVDAVRNSFITIQTLGISGYDAGMAKSGIDESVVVLTTADTVLGFLQPTEYSKTQLHTKINQAIEYIKYGTSSFDLFDRLQFIKAFMQPITTELLVWAAAQNIKPFDENRFFSATAKTLFDSGAWNPYYFSTTGKKPKDTLWASIGEKLFYDKQLSGNGKVSCGTCHQPQNAFTDGLVKATAIDGVSKVGRNTPTILNAALQRFQFYDSRVVYLEDQPKDVIQNKSEMHGNMEVSAKNISNDAVYRALFKGITGTKAIAGADLQKALAAYLQTKVFLNSQFDKYMQGKIATLTPEVKQGFNIFMGKAKCGTCHFAPLFNGMVPPFFDKMESEIIGVPATIKENSLDTDVGKYVLYKSPIHKYSFKTTSVRNAAKTAPYMHNGVYQSLSQVISFYNKGGGLGLGYEVLNQTLPADNLALTTTEQKALVAFIQSLTDSY